MAEKYVRFAAAASAAPLPPGQAVVEAVAVGADGAPVDLGGGQGAAITSAEATTLAAGEQATATIEGGVLRLGIPQGAAGAKGDRGDTGPQGPAGPAGSDATVTPAAHVDPASGTVADVVNALVAAGLMASA